MKKIIFFLLFATIYACNDEPVHSGNTKFETDIVTLPSESGNVCANVPTDLMVTLNGESGEYIFSYQMIEGEGDFYVQNTPVRPEEEITLPACVFHAYYVPTCLGEHRIKLIFSNNEHKNEIMYSVSVDNYSMCIKEPAAENMYLNQDMYLYFSFNAENDTCNTFLTDVTISKGEGLVARIESAVTGNTSGDSIHSKKHDIPDSLFCLSRSSNSYKIRSGLNRIKYTPFTLGEHLLHLAITNNYGYVQTFNLGFNVTYPQYSLSSTIDSLVTTNSRTIFGFTIEGQNSENYLVSYHFLKNSGKVQLNDNNPEPDQPFILHAGRSTGFVTVDSTGETVIEFQVKDSYNNTKKEIMRFSAIRSLTEITTSGFDSLPVTGQEYPFTVRIVNPLYQGKYKITAESPSAEITFNNLNISNKEVTLSDAISASYKPLRPGSGTLTIKLTDDKGQLSIHRLSYTASDIFREIIIKDYNPIIKAQENTRVCFSMKSNIKETYTCKTKFSPANLTGKLNGESCPGECPIKEGDNYIDFIPSTTGDITLRIEIKSDNEATITKDLIFSVSDSPVELEIPDYKRDLITGEESVLSLKILKNNFPDQLSYSLKYDREFLNIRINDKIYINETLKTNNNEPIPLKILPLKTGITTITLHVNDGLSEVKYPLSFNISSNPLKIAVSGFKNECLTNTGNIFKFSVDKKGYYGKFRCKAETTPANAGKIKINGYITEEGKFLTIKNENEISFTPVKSGEISLHLTVTDDNGNEEHKPFTFYVSDPRTELIQLSAVEETISRIKGGSINIAVKRPGYSGKFFLEADQEGCSSLKVANVPYTSKTEIDPDNITVRFQAAPEASSIKLKLTVTDEQGRGLSKSYSFNISDSDLELHVDNSLHEIKAGKPVVLNFFASKPGHTNKLKYRITGSPSGNTTYQVNGEHYTEGEEKEISAEQNVPVALCFRKSGTQQITVTVSDNTTSKSTTLEYKITDSPLKIDTRDFSSLCYPGMTNTSYLAVSKKDYNGKFRCKIIPIPADCGIFTIDGEKYIAGSEVTISNPDNIIISFIPSTGEQATAAVTITDENGNRATENLSYEIQNSELSLSLSGQQDILTGKETNISFNINKAYYTGKFYAEITAENCSNANINGNNYLFGRKIEVRPGTNILKLIPNAINSNVQFKINDETGGILEKSFPLNARKPGLFLEIHSPASDLIAGQTSNFIIEARQEAGDSVHCTVAVNPADAGVFYATNKENLNEFTIASGIPVSILYKALKPGPASINTSITDRYNNKKEKQVLIKVTDSPLEVSISKITEAINGEKASFCLKISKTNYQGKFFAKITGKNCTDLHICGIACKAGEKAEITPECIIDYIPTGNAGSSAQMEIDIYDEWNNHFQKNVSIPIKPGEIVLSPQNQNSEIYVYSYDYASLKFSQAGYSNSDTICYEIKRISGNFLLEDNQNKEYQFNTKYCIKASHSTLLFTIRPQSTEDVIFDVILCDRYGQKKTQRFHYRIKNRNTNIDLLNFNEVTFTEKRERFNIQVSKFNFPSDLKVSISTKGNVSGLQINGNNHSPSIPAEVTCKTGIIIPVSYIPESKGEIEFTISVTDEFGMINTKNVSVTVNSNNVEKLTIPVEYVLTRDNSNDSSYFESYIGKITFDGHDGEGRISDYQTVFSNTEHVILESDVQNSVPLGNVTFPVYTFEGSKPVDDQKQEHVFIRANTIAPIFLKFDKCGTFQTDWGYKFVNTTTNSTVLDIKGPSYCYPGRNYSYSYPGAGTASYYQFHPIDGGGSNYYKPLADDIRNCKIVIYCDIKAVPYKFNIENENRYVQNNQLKSFKFSYTSFASGINKAKVNITNVSSSGGSIEKLCINGIPESQGVYLSPGEEAIVTFIPTGTLDLVITLKEAKTSVISSPVEFISQ